jgi:hypothetical protein
MFANLPEGGHGGMGLEIGREDWAGERIDHR